MTAILQATAYILVRAGYDAMTTNQIAKKAGVNIASLYQYFPNKQAIVVQLAQRHVDETRAAMLPVLARYRDKPLDPETGIRALVEVAATTHAADPELHEIFTVLGPRLGFATMHTEADEMIEKARRAWIASMRGRLPDPALALWVTQTAVHAVFHQAFVEKKAIASSPLLVDEIVRLIAPYLAGSVREPRGRRAPAGDRSRRRVRSDGR